jgi:biopolymer transport protein ExbD
MRVNANSRFPNKLISRIDVSAFAGIMLFLFALFALPSIYFIDHHGVVVDLAKVEHSSLVPHAQREDAITIAINRQGDIFAGNDLLRSYSSLPGRMRESIRRGSEPTIYIRADARAKYRNVKDVIDEIHAAGLEKVVFLVDQRAPGSPK